MRRKGSVPNSVFLKVTLLKSILTAPMFNLILSKASSRFLSLLFVAVALAGCATEPSGPPTVIAVEPAPTPAAIETTPVETAPVAVDDIPSNAPAGVRAHLIKLRELRDQGKISEGDYQSRRALLLNR